MLSQGRVLLYNSMHSKKLTPELVKQLVTLYGHTGDKGKLHVFMPQVQQQKGITDFRCSVVAIAVFLFGDDPSALLSYGKDKQKRLTECLLLGQLTPFSASEKKAEEKKKKES